MWEVHTGGIPQQLDIDMCTALWQQKQTQHCKSEKEHSIIMAMVLIVP